MFLYRNLGIPIYSLNSIFVFWNIAKLVRPSFLVRIFKGSNPFIPKSRNLVLNMFLIYNRKNFMLKDLTNNENLIKLKKKSKIWE